MASIDVASIRTYLLNRYSAEIDAQGLAPTAIGDDFDLLQQGVIDSMGIIELLGDLEQHFGKQIDFDGMDADDLTVVGPLSTYIAEQLRSDSATTRERADRSA